MGLALAQASVDRAWQTTLLLGPTAIQTVDPRVRVVRFRSCADLQALLRQHVGEADVLIMAAAVADYRPMPNQAAFQGGKFRRTSEKLTLELEPTPDLLAEVGATRREDQLFVGFALEPRAEMLDAARAKMRRKRIDMIIANPLETMDSPDIEATLLSAEESRPPQALPPMPKTQAARVLIDAISLAWQQRSRGGTPPAQGPAGAPTIQVAPRNDAQRTIR